jgi:hypothetical protein
LGGLRGKVDIYFAGNFVMLGNLDQEKTGQAKVCKLGYPLPKRLISFYYIEQCRQVFEYYLHNDNAAVMLDSGAYSAFSQKQKLDINEYIACLIKYNQHPFSYLNLDIKGNGRKSFRNYE